MDRVSIADVDSRSGPASVKRSVSDALGATDVAVNYYELAPGESFAFGYHAHDGQEELFVLREGRVTFETETGDVEVGAGEAVRFAPGEYQRGVNDGDARVVALAIGAPRESGRTDVRRECPSCGERTPAAIGRPDGDDVLVTTCRECGAETGRFE